MRSPRSSIEVLRSVHYLWREPEVREQYSAAISLHSHTMHSRENFGFVPRILACATPGQALLERLEAWHQRLYGKPIPFGRAFWRPPLNPQAAYHLEHSQIQNLLGLRSFVSLTDHDSIEACAELRAIGIEVPYSTEWSVPYHGTMFHIGVHNLPAEEARAFERAMAGAIAAPTRERIAELLAASTPQMMCSSCSIIRSVARPGFRNPRTSGSWRSFSTNSAHGSTRSS